MSAMATNVDTGASPDRRAFDLFEGYAVSSVLAGLEMSGLLADLEGDGIARSRLESWDSEKGALFGASLRYLAEREILRQDADRYVLTDYGRAVCQDKGYLVWLVGGYGEPLRRLDAFLSGEKRYGPDHPRDGRWVADGAAMLGRTDVVPYALDLLNTVTFDNVLDLGCGNAKFLLTVCERFGARGIGVDISPEACAVADETIRAAGHSDRVRVVQGDAGDLSTISGLENVQLVVSLFLLHEILARGQAVLVRYLRDLAARLPRGAFLLVAEVEPPSAGGEPQRFTPEFTFVHALMRQTLLSADEWRDALLEGGFRVRQVVRDRMPSGVLLLAESGAR